MTGWDLDNSVVVVCRVGCLEGVMEGFLVDHFNILRYLVDDCAEIKDVVRHSGCGK